MFVGVLDAPIVLILKFVVFAIRIRIAPLPKSLYELVALFVVRELHERFAFVVSDDPANVLVQPLLIRGPQFFPQGFRILLFLLFSELSLEGIARSIVSCPVLILGLIGLRLISTRLTVSRARIGKSRREGADDKQKHERRN